jgi:hypothetical protein
LPIKKYPNIHFARRQAVIYPSFNRRALPSREIPPQSGSDLLQRPVDLISGNHKRRRDADRVSMGVPGKDASAVCTENLIRVDAVMESPKLAE